MSRPTVAVVGRCAVAFYGAGRHVDDAVDRVPLGQVSIQVGGGGAIAAVTCAALGCHVRLASKLADDFLGRHAGAALRDAGIDASLVYGPGQLSPFTFTAVGGGPRGRTFAAGGDVPPLRPEDVAADDLLAGARALLVDASDPATHAHVAAIARQRDVPVIVDAGELREGVGELIPLADVLIASERLAADIAPRGELQDALLELQQLGPRAVVITLGDAGAIGIDGSRLVRQPAPEVDVVDCTGAGHVFHGAFAAALVGRAPFERCVAFATVAASLSCAALGPLAGLPSRDDIEARLD
ncbi:MAG: hypothetical protein D6689_09525 [Deltaproteobacteria bacterium]|nr:MAG: hypothetical protein D6689_09525 [Deltaproteobacteria bacterium]